MFVKFNDDVAVHKNVIESEGMDVAKMAVEPGGEVLENNRAHLRLQDHVGVG